MIEKPKKGQEFSNYSILGRVLLTPEIYNLLARTQLGTRGEIQMTDAMARFARNYSGMTAVDLHRIALQHGPTAQGRISNVELHYAPESHGSSYLTV
jgi:UDP-glucose pyrophosphorylase